MTVDLQRLKRGESLSGIPSVTWNAFCDTAEIVARSGIAGQRNERVVGYPAIIDVVNDTDEDRQVGEVFGIDALALNKLDEIVANGTFPTAADHWMGLIAIAIEPAVVGGLARCVLSGLARAVVDVTDTAIRTVDLVDGDGTKLESHLAGRARLLISAASTGLQDAWLLLGGPRQLDWTGVANGTITAGGTGTVVVDGVAVSLTVSLDKFHGGQNISSGKEVGIKWFDYDQKWRVMHAECED